MKKTILSLLILLSFPAFAIEESYHCLSLHTNWEGQPLVEIKVNNSDYQGRLQFTLNEGGGRKHQINEDVQWTSADASGVAIATSLTFELHVKDTNSSNITAVLLPNDWTWGDQNLVCVRN